MKKLSNFFTVVSGVFGVVPGIAILSTNMGVPPNASKAMFGGIIEALGVLTLVLLWVNKGWVNKMTLKAINNLAFIGIGLFLVSLFAYIFFYGYLVEEVPNSQSLYFPLWPKGDLQQGLKEFGNRSELIKQWGRDDVYKVINSSSKTSLLITTLILLFIYQLVFISLTFCFGILGIKASGAEPIDT